MSIPTPACTPAARPDPVPRAASPAGAGLWIAPAVWKTRTIRSRLNAPASRRVSHTALDGTERRPHAPQARSLYSSNTTSRVGLVHPLRIRWEKTDRPTSLRSDERSRSPESVFTIPGFGVQLHRNAQAPRITEMVSVQDWETKALHLLLVHRLDYRPQCASAVGDVVVFSEPTYAAYFGRRGSNLQRPPATAGRTA